MVKMRKEEKGKGEEGGGEDSLVQLAKSLASIGVMMQRMPAITKREMDVVFGCRAFALSSHLLCIYQLPV